MPKPSSPTVVTLPLAIELTTTLLVRRAQVYRNIVIAVVVIASLTLLLSIYFANWRLLAGMVWIAPITGLFFVIDAKLVRAWRTQILHSCAEGSLDRVIWEDMLRRFTHLPRATLHSMLATLPNDLSHADENELLHQRSEMRCAMVVILFSTAAFCFTALAL